jgi:hypothetical protein
MTEGSLVAGRQLGPRGGAGLDDAGFGLYLDRLKKYFQFFFGYAKKLKPIV